MISKHVYHLPLIALAVLVSAQGVRAQHFDIFLARPASGTQTVIGGADVDTLSYDDTTRVFEVELGAVPGEFLALEPGVNHPDLNNPVGNYPSLAAGLQQGDELSLTERDFSVNAFVDDLFYWNGTGSTVFAPAAADFRIDGGDPLGSTAGLGGAYDDHPFLVVDDDSLPGIYLASVHGTVTGFAPSVPVFLVMGTEGLITADFLGISQAEFDALSDDEIDEALEVVIEQAAEYVAANLVVPEPNSIVLLATFGCAFAAVAGFRNRRHSVER